MTMSCYFTLIHFAQISLSFENLINGDSESGHKNFLKICLTVWTELWTSFFDYNHLTPVFVIPQSAGKKKKFEKNLQKLDSTPHCSRVVPHPSTERAQTALTSVFG